MAAIDDLDLGDQLQQPKVTWVDQLFGGGRGGILHDMPVHTVKTDMQ